jgi:DUF3071 family protein
VEVKERRSMQDLTPVGLDEDGTRLVLVSPSGEEFTVPVDARLRAAMRGDNARHGQLEKKMDSALRPRDIQARIRAGESPEDVAAAAQTTVEAIMPFAGPVIAERQHVAQNALKGSLRRRTGDTTTAARTLGEAAELYFAEHSLHDEDVEWDAWRRPDGRWLLVAAYAVGGSPRRAEFTHDLPGRYVVADNDDARILTGEIQQPEAPGMTGRPVQARRLSSVHTQDELPLGDDAIELVRDPGTPEPAPSEDVADPTADTADADWLTDTSVPAPDDVPLIEEPLGEPVAEPVAQATVEAEAPSEVEVEADSSGEPDPDTEETAEVPTGEKPSGSKRKGRSSVPSWDEIMFGGSAKDD